MNIDKWIREVISSPKKGIFPLLSYPGTTLLGITVKEAVTDETKQAEMMVKVANELETIAAVGPMDLSIEAECFKAEIYYAENAIPTVKGDPIIVDEDDANAMETPHFGAGRTSLCVNAIKMAKERINDRPLFAGCIGPYSLSGRLMGVSDAMVACYSDPDMLKTVLNKCTNFIIEYVKEFKNVGADGLIIAEPLAGLLSPDLTEEFSEPYVKRIIDSVQDESFAVIYHNCGDTARLQTDSILRTGAKGISFGNSIKLSDVLPKIPENVLVIGNIDPVGAFLNGDKENMRNEVNKLMSECSKYPNFIPSSGCDIPALAKWENIHEFEQAVRDFQNK